MCKILGDSVGHRTFKMVPNKLCRVEFRSISWKTLWMQAGVSLKAFADGRTPMYPAIIPQHKDGTLQVPDEMPQKLRHFGVFDVLIGIKPGIQGNVSSFWRNTEGRDRRNLAPVACTAQDRGLAFRRPGPAHIGNQQKSALIQKDQMGAKPFGLFLYGASGSASSARWPLRPAPGPASLASDNSSPGLLRPAKHDGDDSKSRIVARSLPPPGAGSKAPSDSQSLKPPSKVSGSTLFSGVPRAWGVFPERAWALVPARLSSGRSAAIETPNSQSSQSSWPRPTDLTLFSATRQHVGGAVRAAFAFRWVSCLKYNIFSITFAYINNKLTTSPRVLEYIGKFLTG